MITILYLALIALFAKGALELTLGILQLLLGIAQGTLALLMDAWDWATQKE
jgi:hypothetical protein